MRPCGTGVLAVDSWLWQGRFVRLNAVYALLCGRRLCLKWTKSPGRSTVHVLSQRSAAVTRRPDLGSQCCQCQSLPSAPHDPATGRPVATAILVPAEYRYSGAHQPIRRPAAPKIAPRSANEESDSAGKCRKSMRHNSECQGRVKRWDDPVGSCALSVAFAPALSQAAIGRPTPCSSNPACGFLALGFQLNSCLRPRKVACRRRKVDQAVVFPQPYV